MLKKLLMLVLTLLAVSFVVFAAFSILPGDPALQKLGTEATPEKVEALREQMGLNEPFLLRYGKWLLGMFTFDFGKSYSYSMSVTDLIGSKIFINFTMSALALVLVCVISIPIGIYTAKHVGGITDKIFTVINQLFMSVPPFLLGLLLTFIFGLTFRFFTPGGYVDYRDNFIGFVGYLICPAVALALPKCAMCIRLLKANILEEAKKDYARTAYSRGNSTTSMLYRHILQNAIMPTITFIGMVVADMIASGIIIEQVFGIPGLGRSLLAAISTRDYPVVMAIVMLIAAGIVIISTITDLIYAWMDPRVRVTDKSE
ncbi:MAG: ABC transporter permease [Lachnospiraceae bacterium]|nr:ABC transporter permease [Lachnospiraceae bacterium]